MSKRYGTLQDRFWRHVIPEPNSGCWLWDGPVDDLGYGRFRVGERKERVHRLSYKLHCGKIPRNRLVLHSCDVPACVNPAHLRLGTNADNIADKVLRKRQAVGRKSPSAKLTPEQVLAIRAAAGTMTQRALGQLYGVSHAVVGQIIRNVKWKYLVANLHEG